MTKDEVIDIIKDSGFGMLATTEGDQPRVRPMMPFYDEDTNKLLVALLGRSRTIEQVKQNPLVEICYVDRKMWYARVTGTGTLTNDSENKEKVWNAIPMLRQYFGGIEDPNFILMEVEITHIESMTPHDKEPQSIAL